MEIEDFVETEKGWVRKTRALEHHQAGSISTYHDESRSTLERGPVTSPSSMWSAAVAGDSVLARRVLDAPTNAARNQELQEQAMKFAQAARLAKQGALVSSADYSAGGSIGLKKIIGVGVEEE